MKTRTTLIIMLFASTIYSNAQYTLTTSNQAYTDLIDATSLTGGVTWDDPDVNIDIPFSFYLFGKKIEQLSLSEGFGHDLFSPLVGDTTDLLTSSSIDIIDRAYNFDNGDGDQGGLSHVSYKVEGMGW